MKKIVVIAFCLLLLSELGYSQIEVGPNNNVGVGISGTVNSKLSVNTNGISHSVVSFYGDASTANALYCNKALATSSTAYALGVRATVLSGVGSAQGITGSAYNSTVYTTGKAYGVYGYAGNAQSGYNYGVKGLLLGSNNGAGIYGTSTNTDVYINGKYAGYFYGNAKITGTLTVGQTVYPSDENLKKEIRELESNNIEKIKRVKAVKYKYKTPQESGLYKSNSSDTAAYEMNAEMLAFYEKERIGLLAQELQKVYPDIVVESPDGTLGVDYIALIPVLLEAIKEQQTAIENLTEEVNKIKRKSDKQ
jgi:hypothetical protein